MTDEEIERFALVLKECARIRALIAREEAALSNGEHDYGNTDSRCAKSASARRTAPRRVPQRARKEPGEFAESRRTRRSIRWILREAEGKKSYAEKLRSVLRPTLLGWTP
jgi:hypothetical protein